MSRPGESVPESRALTVRDWFFVFAGVGAALLMPGPVVASGFLGISPMQAAFALATQVVLAPTFIVTIASLGRQFQYRRAARPAERLALTLVGWQVASAVPNLDTTIQYLAVVNNMDRVINWPVCRWSLAGISLLLAVVVACLSHSLCGRRSHWLQSLSVIVVVALLFWAPLDMLRRSGPWPSHAAASTTQALLIRDAFYCVPHGLVFGVPAIATLLSWCQRPRGWLWTEWVSAVSALALALLWLVMVAVSAHPGPAGPVWNGLVWSVWALVVCALSVLYCIRAKSAGAARIPPPARRADRQ